MSEQIVVRFVRQKVAAPVEIVGRRVADREPDDQGVAGAEGPDRQLGSRREPCHQDEAPTRGEQTEGEVEVVVTPGVEVQVHPVRGARCRESARSGSR